MKAMKPMKVCVLDFHNPWIGELVGKPNMIRIKVKDDKGKVHLINRDDCEFLVDGETDIDTGVTNEI